MEGKDGPHMRIISPYHRSSIQRSASNRYRRRLWETWLRPFVAFHLNILPLTFTAPMRPRAAGYRGYVEHAAADTT